MKTRGIKAQWVAPWPNSTVRAQAALALVLFALSTNAVGCVQFGVSRVRAEEPIVAEVLLGILPGETTFGECLERLGAPELVFASLEGELVIAYAWRDDIRWGISVSHTFRSFLSASLSWDSTSVQTPGIVLVFDRQLRLLHIEQGFLRDLLGVPEVELEVEDPGFRVLRSYRG